MQRLSQWTLCVSSLMLGLRLTAAGPDTATLDPNLFRLPPPAEGQQHIEVNIPQNLIGLVARAAEAQEPEIADLLREIRGVRVTVLGLDDGNRDGVLAQFGRLGDALVAASWDAVASVREGSEDIRVFVKTRGEEAVEGVVVEAMDGGGEAILVCITGNIRPEQVGLIGERFDIEPLKKIGHRMEKK